MSSLKNFPLALLIFSISFFSGFSNIFSEEIRNTIDIFTFPQPGYIQILITADGSTNIGRITKIGERDIEFKTDLGVITIPKEKIRSIREIPESSFRSGKYWFPDPNSTRLFFAPTGRMLTKGHGYFADYDIFLPSINVGISENISLGGGMTILPSGSLKNQVYFFTPKIGFKASEKLNIAGGALVIKIPDIGDDNESPLVSVLYGVGTYGSPDRSVTFGLGYGMVDSKFGDKPLIVLGAEQRLSRRTAFVTENWMVPGVSNMLVSYGIRFFSENLSVDLALMNTTGSDAIFPGVPYVDFVYNF
jgi:hypothetical protein